MTDLSSQTALVLFSGGQDSTTCLAWALERFQHVETVAFDYRQRHRIELDQRLVVLDEIRRRLPQWADRLGEDHFVDMAVLGQLIAATQGRCPDVCDLAREVRFCYVDAPLLKRIRDHGVLVGLSAHNPGLVELASRRAGTWTTTCAACIT